MASKRSSVRYEARHSASFVTFQKPCEEALRDLSEAYNKLADRIEDCWANEQVARDALVALWSDRRSDKYAELYAEAMTALGEWKPQETC